MVYLIYSLKSPGLLLKRITPKSCYPFKKGSNSKSKENFKKSETFQKIQEKTNESKQKIVKDSYLE